MSCEKKNKKMSCLHFFSLIFSLILTIYSDLVLSANPVVTLAPGLDKDTTADGVLGQLDFVHNAKNFIDGRGLNMDTSNGVGDVAIDKSVTPNRVYVTDQNNNRVLGWDNIAAFASHGAATIVIGQPDFSSNIVNNGGISAKSLNTPSGVAVDSLGNLYIADTGNNRVLFYKTPFSSDKVADDVFGQYGGFNTGTADIFGINENTLDDPVRVAVDTAGNLFVADESNNRVLEFNTPQSITGITGSGDQTADRIFGQFNSFSSSTCNNAGINANSLCLPVGITVDGLGNLYVADYNNSRVLKFNTPLTTDTIADKVYGQLNLFTTGLCNNGGVTANSLCHPMSVAVAPDGAVYISERSNHRVLSYPASGATTANKVLGQFGGFITNLCNNTGGGTLTPINPKGLCYPDGLALDTSVSPNSPNLYVSDTANRRVLQFKPSKISATNLTLIIKSGQAAQGIIGQSLFTTNFVDAMDGRGFAFTDSSPDASAVAIDRSTIPNRIYVSDFANNRVLGWNDIAAFTTHASATLIFGQPNPFVNTANNGGISKSSLNGPMGLTVDSFGNLYVADQNNNRVLEFNTPFTSDTSADRVFGQSGIFVTNAINQSGLNANSLYAPTGLAIDSTNSLYVADFNNHRVLKYNTPLSTNTTADKVYGQSNNFTSRTANLGGITANSLNNPYGVAVDSSDNLYVADYNNNRALEFDKLPATDTTADKVFGQGNVFTTNTSNSGGLGSNSLDNPVFVAVNTSGSVFISDFGNNRVLKYDNPLTTDRTADKVFGHTNVFTTNGCKTLNANSLCSPYGIAVDITNGLYTVDATNNRVLQYLAP